MQYFCYLCCYEDPVYLYISILLLLLVYPRLHTQWKTIYQMRMRAVRGVKLSNNSILIGNIREITVGYISIYYHYYYYYQLLLSQICTHTHYMGIASSSMRYCRSHLHIMHLPARKHMEMHFPYLSLLLLFSTLNSEQWIVAAAWLELVIMIPTAHAQHTTLSSLLSLRRTIL